MTGGCSATILRAEPALLRWQLQAVSLKVVVTLVVVLSCQAHEEVSLESVGGVGQIYTGIENKQKTYRNRGQDDKVVDTCKLVKGSEASGEDGCNQGKAEQRLIRLTGEKVGKIGSNQGIDVLL